LSTHIGVDQPKAALPARGGWLVVAGPWGRTER
jgi:hypothetical protein